MHGHSGPLGLQHAFIPEVTTIPADAPVADLFGQVAQAPCALPVVEPNGRFRGVVSKTTLLRFLDRDTPPVPPSPPQADDAALATTTSAATATTERSPA